MKSMTQSVDHLPLTTQSPLPVGATQIAKDGLRKTGLLRYSADWTSIVVVVAALTIQFGAYFTSAPWYWCLPVLVSMRWLHLVEHNHAHLPLFHQRWLNEPIGWLMFLNCGCPLDMYREQHVRVHHVHTQGPKDWTSPYAFSGASYPDKPVNYWYYLLAYAPITWARCLSVFLANPQSRIARQFWVSLAFVVSASVAMAYHDPVSFLIFFPLTWIACFIGVPVNNWDHHKGCDVTSPYTAANTDLRAPSTWLGFNIGYHAAHTWYPGLHWSKLADFHDRFMLEHVPQERYLPRVAEAEPTVAMGRSEVDDDESEGLVAEAPEPEARRAPSRVASSSSRG